MLKKLLKMLNLGLFKNGTPDPIPFELITLVYAENGRGKSTLASLFKATGGFDSRHIASVRTIDAEDEPALEMLFERDGVSNRVSHVDGKWQGKQPEVFVFDPSFVEENVYSGQEVRADQRQELLKFALGTETVHLEREVARLTDEIAAATRQSGDAKRRISAYAKQLSVPEFIALAPDAQAEEKIAGLRSRLEAAKHSSALMQRVPPGGLPRVDLEVDSFFAILNATVADIREEARSRVHEHFERHKQSAGIEEWVAKGRQFVNQADCPFCGQDLGASDLISAYDSYFNQAYDALLKQVGVLSRGVNVRLAPSRVEEFRSVLNANEARILAWGDQMDLKPPSFDIEKASASFQAARELCLELAQRKERQPLESIGSDPVKAEVADHLRALQQQVATYEGEINEIARQIKTYVQGLANESPAALSASIGRLEATIARRDEAAAAAITDFNEAETRKTTLNQEKLAAKERLNALLPEVLASYQTRINALLGRFNASFQIVNLGQSYVGGQLRSEYALQLRGRSVELGNRTGAGLNFRNALSEADKRTLALAFFIARLQATGHDLTGKLVVLDDPVSSLDANRRRTTIDTIIELINEKAQVVVLSHDPQFLLEVQRRAAKECKDVRAARTYEIGRVTDDYSALGECDIGRICESPYYTRFRNVRDFVAGTFGGSRGDLAGQIRPLVEGFYKRRFPPPILPDDETLGGIIKRISEADALSPLAGAKPSLQKLHALNQATTGSHHDDGDSARCALPPDSELKRQAEMALSLIYGESIPP